MPTAALYSFFIRFSWVGGGGGCSDIIDLTVTSYTRDKYSSHPVGNAGPRIFGRRIYNQHFRVFLSPILIQL